MINTTVEMSKLCFVFLIFSLCVLGSDGFCPRPNMGTVLFTASDIHRTCWSPEEIAILTTRMILEDLLPDPKILTIDDNDYVNDIVEYFRLLIDIVRIRTQGRKKHISMIALTDLIGGYLQHAVLPAARHAYYSGVIGYPSMEKLIQLFEEIKWFLRTNGQGWTPPIESKIDYDIQIIDFEKDAPKANRSCCRNLIYYKREPSKKRSVTSSMVGTTCGAVYFPMPFFDSKVRPTAIAVPFKRYALRNIESKKAAYLILKYYISVYRCMRDLHSDVGTVQKFQNHFYTWVIKEVKPMMSDDKFYSPFGGIFRVEETLKSMGAKVLDDTCAPHEDGEEELGTVPGGETSTRSSMVLMSMLIIIFIWFIIGTLFICYRMRANSKDCPGKGSTNTACTSETSSIGLSKISSKRSMDTCKCGGGTSTTRSSQFSSQSSEEESRLKKMRRKAASKSQILFSACKRHSNQSCMCNEGPAVIDTKHSMKVLPSIPEISENSSSKPPPPSPTKDSKKGKPAKEKERRISFGPGGPAGSKDKLGKGSNQDAPSQDMMDIQLVPCPHFSDKGTSVSSSRSKSTPPKGQETQYTGSTHSMHGPNTSETTDTVISANNPHVYACHSSLTGNYASEKYSSEKPFIYGYDFQTSSSSGNVFVDASFHLAIVIHTTTARFSLSMTPGSRVTSIDVSSTLICSVTRHSSFVPRKETCFQRLLLHSLATSSRKRLMYVIYAANKSLISKIEYLFCKTIYYEAVLLFIHLEFYRICLFIN